MFPQLASQCSASDIGDNGLHDISLTVLSAWGVGDPSRGPKKTASQTNWLTVCRSDADCGVHQCRCGTCTYAGQLELTTSARHDARSVATH